MARLNAMADLDGRRVPEVAAAFLGTDSPRFARGHAMVLAEIVALTLDHLVLVLSGRGGDPPRRADGRARRALPAERASSSCRSIAMLQTIPALALLMFMIPLFGIGKGPALVALSVYALLPIVRGTHAGVIGIDRQLLEIAFVLRPRAAHARLRVELPLASISIMAGIKTAVVMTVGTATLAAFIGGGGYGSLIVRGLALDDTATILAGAAPAAGMALAFHGLFELLDRVTIPRGLRLERGRAHLLRWRPRQPAQRTESTPRRLPSGAASQLDPSPRSSRVHRQASSRLGALGRLPAWH